ncbi:MAG TPA: pyridoxal-phosphate dependent enzyme [Marmoricola sp.]|nr:pyridoxal-phosphate dependent enzyme [Marmoricola sp.]
MKLDEQRLADLEVVRRTTVTSPLVRLAEPVGRGNTVWLKLESAQVVRSFKIRGATYALSRHAQELRRRGVGVVADSGGNHSQALAFAGARLGVPVRIVMASVVPENKKRATQSFGAIDGSFHLDTSPADFVSAKARAKAAAEREGWHYLSPYDDEDIIRGAGTLVPEIIQQLDELGAARPDTVHVPVGGGGLISGIADVNSEHGRLFALYGHEIVDADSAARSFHSPEPVPVPGEPNRYAEGLAVKVMGERPHQRLKDGRVDRIYVVDLAAVGQAYEWYSGVVLPQLGFDLHDPDQVRQHLPEVSSMVAVAGLCEHLRQVRAENQTHLVVVSGGNTDHENVRAAVEAHRAGAAR